MSDRLRFIVELRFFIEPPQTLKQVGQQLGVSPQRASQLQATALWQMRWQMRRLLFWEPDALDREREAVNEHG